MKDLETIIRKLVDKKAEQNNKIDLNAYENGIREFAEAINYSQCCMGEAEQLFCSCGSRKVKTTGGSQCTNNRCSL